MIFRCVFRQLIIVTCSLIIHLLVLRNDLVLGETSYYCREDNYCLLEWKTLFEGRQLQIVLGERTTFCLSETTSDCFRGDNYRLSEGDKFRLF